MPKLIRSYVHHYLGQRAYRAGQHEKSFLHLNKSVELRANNPAALCDRAVSYQQLGDHQRAFRELSRAIQLAPSLAIAYYNRGISAKIIGDLDQAAADQLQATKLKVRYHEAHGELGCIKLCKGEAGLAITHFNKALTLCPNAAGYYKGRGYAHFQTGNYSSAAADFGRSLAFEDDPYIAMFCFIAQARLAGLDEAVAQAKPPSTKLWPTNFFDLFLGNKSLVDVIACAENDIQRAEAHFYVGQWCLLTNQPTAAKSAFRRAVEACPSNLIERSLAAAELDYLRK